MMEVDWTTDAFTITEKVATEVFTSTVPAFSSIWPAFMEIFCVPWMEMPLVSMTILLPAASRVEAAAGGLVQLSTLTFARGRRR